MKHFQNKAWAVGILAALVLALFVPSGVWALSQGKDEKIDINSATAQELQELPRIGETVAQRIVEFRQKNGKFKKIEELMKVKGIGEKTFLQLKDRITVGEPEK